MNYFDTYWANPKLYYTTNKVLRIGYVGSVLFNYILYEDCEDSQSSR